jgi:hypothetical protein
MNADGCFSQVGKQQTGYKFNNSYKAAAQEQQGAAAATLPSMSAGRANDTAVSWEIDSSANRLLFMHTCLECAT